MKFKKFTEKAAALSMATAMLASVCAPTYTAVLSAVPVAAASSKDTTNNTATTKDLANADIIDTSKTGSITVHKYDITSAEAAGDYTEGQYKATGESDNRVENALADYAIQGVQFTYLRVGNIEQYSKTDGTGSNIKVVYEIPTALAQILKLNEADATVMTGDGVSAPCTNAGVLHYTSTQIEDALAAIIKADDVAAKNALESYLIEYKDQNKDSDDVQTADTGVIETDANGLATKSGLPLGLYLMVETKVPEQVTSTVNPWFISLPFTNTAADTNTNTDHSAIKDGGTVTLYALYNVDDFTLSFDANGGTGKLNSVTHKGNQSYALPVNTFTRIGYEFRGWSFDKYTDTISYKNGATYDNRLISATLYAQWKKTGTGFIQRPFLDSDMFYKAISILGNNGTVYNKNSVDSRMAHIDTANNPGYFSLLK